MIGDMSQSPPRWLMRLTAVAIFFAIVRNLLPPNAFTATVLLFDYEFGLVRRGLIGELANFYWGDTVSQTEVFALSAALTLFGVAATAALFFRWFSATLAGALLLLLLFSSFAFSAIIASTGYLDLLLIGMVCLVMLTDPAQHLGVLLRGLVCVIGLLMHEVMLPYFAVFLAFDIWLARPLQGAESRVAVSLVPLIAGFAAFAVILVWGQLPAENIDAYLQHIEAKSEFSAEPEATVVMERTLGDNMRMMAEKRQKADYRAWVLFDGLPLLAMTLWLIWLNFKLLARNAGGITRILLLGAIFAPLSLNVIAFDVVRFGALSVFVGFLAIISQMRTDPGVHDRLTTVMSWPVFVIVLLLNLNVAVNQINTGEGHQFLFPWALVEQLSWLE